MPGQRRPPSGPESKSRKDGRTYLGRKRIAYGVDCVFGQPVEL
jgi:hypothetical protein